MDPFISPSRGLNRIPVVREPVTPPERQALENPPERSINLSAHAISQSTRFGLVPGWINDYVGFWIKNPEPGSAFERKTRFARWLPSSVLIVAMKAMGYDGIICRRDGHVVGHLFFQRHGNSLHMFSVSVAEELQGRGLGTILVTTFLEWSRSRPDIASVRIGAGGEARVKAMFHRLGANAPLHGIIVDSKFFVHFVDRQARMAELPIGSTQSILLRPATDRSNRA